MNDINSSPKPDPSESIDQNIKNSLIAIIYINTLVWFLILLIFRPFRDKFVNLLSIVDILAITILAIVFTFRFEMISPYGYFKDYVVILFVIAASLPGTFVVIIYKTIKCLKEFIIRAYPYIKRFTFMIYKASKSYILMLKRVK